jgi:hypothetical protein
VENYLYFEFGTIKLSGFETKGICSLLFHEAGTYIFAGYFKRVFTFSEWGMVYVMQHAY